MTENEHYKLKFGKHKGKPLDKIPLLYLDWLLGQDWLQLETSLEIGKYLAIPSIARELEKQLENKED